MRVTAAALAAAACLSGAAAQYDPTMAQEFLYLAASAYCSQSAITAWNCAACQSAPAMGATTFLSDDNLQVYGYVGKLADSSAIVVGFRGTDPSDIENWIVDFNATKSEMYPGCSGCEVHSGFYTSYLGLSPQMLDAINQYGGMDAPAIYVTGHSLGAAMATLATFELVLAGYPVTNHYNFGDPRVGNPTYVDAFVNNVGTNSGKGLRLNVPETPGKPMRWSPVLTKAVERAMAHPDNAALLTKEAMAGSLNKGLLGVTAPQGSRAGKHAAMAAGMAALRRHVLGQLTFPTPLYERAGAQPGARELRMGVEALRGKVAAPKHAEVAAAAAKPKSALDAAAYKLTAGGVQFFRATHWRDPVPHLPLEIMGFEHAPTEIWWNSDSSSYSVCSSSDGEDPTCSDSLDFDLSIPDHLEYMGYPISDSC